LSEIPLYRMLITPSAAARPSEVGTTPKVFNAFVREVVQAKAMTWPPLDYLFQARLTAVRPHAFT